MPTNKPKKTIKKTIAETNENSAKQTDIKNRFNLPQLSKKTKTISIVTVLVILSLLYYFRGLFIVATVNNQPITRLALIKELEKKGGKQVLESMVNQTLILQETKKQKVTVTDAEISTEIKKIEDNLKKQGQNFDQVLQLQGLTKESLKEEIKLQKMIEKMLASKVKVNDREVKEYIEKNKNNLGEDIKPENIKKQLEQQKLQEVFQTWLQDLQKKAKITYFVTY